MIAIALALFANTVFKLGVVATIGGRPLARRVILPALASVAAGAVAVFTTGG